MRRLSDEQVRKLRQEGIRVRDDDGRLYLPKLSQPQTVQPKPQEQPPAPAEPKIPHEIVKSILAVMGQAEANTGMLIKVAEELSKPREKRTFRHIVGRDDKGKIKYIETKEQ